MDATTTAAISAFASSYNLGITSILPAVVAAITPIWPTLLVVVVVLGVVGGLLGYVLPKRGVRIGRKVRI